MFMNELNIYSYADTSFKFCFFINCIIDSYLHLGKSSLM